MTADYAIETANLGRVYRLRENKKKNQPKELVALSNVNVQVPQGELFGLLGPNGAGKSTLIKILVTLLAPSTGWARVAGYDVVKDTNDARRHLNMVSGGEVSGYGLLPVRKNLWLFSQFSGIPSKEAYRRIDQLLEMFGLKDRAGTKSSDLSTGLRQKMNIIRGFMTNPDVLFLDEPTLGLDVGAARDVRQFVQQWMKEDPHRTVLLTTHTLVEADDLCDRIAIINKGKVLDCDTSHNLKKRLQHDAIFDIEVAGNREVNGNRYEALPGVNRLTYEPSDGFTTYKFVLDTDGTVADVVEALTKDGLRIQNLQKREPTLEDVFVALVGRSMAEEEGTPHGQ
ncbi:MAG TPA: ABC transporter ATP-binding protein [Bellilinea sp.]|nr:ABC transporter ATP-binding protein [Bellilinea sp.]